MQVDTLGLMDSMGRGLRRAPHLWGMSINLVFCTFIGLALSALNNWQELRENLIVSWSIGPSIYVSSVGLAVALSPRFPIQVITTLGMLIGLFFGLMIGGRIAFGRFDFFFVYTGGVWIGVVFGIIGVVFFGALGALWDVRARLAQAERERLVQTAELAQAELRVLQAQIEPHFLFNTLSNVLSLIPVAPDRATTMLERLTGLLRVSLKRGREAATTVCDEIEVVRAYLHIQQMRMPDRLRFRIDVDREAELLPLPALLLQPLVENAVTHGAEPRTALTTIEVSVRREGSGLVLQVADDGEGIDPDGGGRGHGTALANIRARITSLHAEHARLSLRERKPSGMIARIELPLSDRTA